MKKDSRSNVKLVTPLKGVMLTPSFFCKNLIHRGYGVHYGIIKSIPYL